MASKGKSDGITEKRGRAFKMKYGETMIRGEVFVKRYIFKRLVGKYNLEPDDFAKLQINFKENWHPA